MNETERNADEYENKITETKHSAIKVDFLL